MKKVLSFVLAFIAVFSLVSFSVNNVNATNIEPRLNNTNSATTGIGINSSGKATISFACIGISGVTTRIVAETKVERKWGIFWLDVDGAEWVDTTTNRHLTKTYEIQLSKTGTYRVTTKFTVSGTGGSNDVIEVTSQDVYE